MKRLVSPACPLCWQRDLIPVPSEVLTAMDLVADRLVARLLAVIDGRAYVENNVAGEVWAPDEPVLCDYPGCERWVPCRHHEDNG